MVLWVLPGLAIVTGLLWVLYRSKNWVEQPTKEMTGLTPEEEQKIMDDLGRFEKS
jgi:cytochrome c-type biogenesis protein CcmH/NrfF